MLYEIRHYDVPSSRSLLLLKNRFADHTLRIWERFGIQPVGFWSTVVGSPVFRLTYLLAWEDLGQRQELWDRFTSDPEWQAVREESHRRAGGTLVTTIHSEILRPTSFSRLPRWDNQPSRLSGGLFELRTYSFTDTASLDRVSAWFETQGTPQLEKHGLYAMGFWTTYIGVSPRLTYMLVFENMAHRERAWASFYTDPAWPLIQDGLYPDGKPLIAEIHNCLMTGTEFSGWS